MTGKAEFFIASDLLQHLSRNSTPYSDPLAKIDWSSLSAEQFWLPEQALSLYGLPEYAQLSQAQKIHLSQLEFVHLISQGLWLESLFMERMSQSLQHHLRHGQLDEYTYSLHELREEAGHSLMFLQLIQESGLRLSHAHSYKHHLVRRMLRRLPADSALLWTLTLIGEELPDRLNRFVKNHRHQLSPVPAKIVQLHVIDEARHIAHAREMCSLLLPKLGKLQGALTSRLVNYFMRFFIALFYYPPASLYQQAGLDGKLWYRRCHQSQTRQAFVASNVKPLLRQLRQYGLHCKS